MVAGVLAAAGVDDFGLVRVPKTPVQVQEQEVLTYKVLFTSLFVGSLQKNMDELAVDLSKTKWENGQPMFNVTIITSPVNSHLSKHGSETLHIIQFEEDPTNFINSIDFKLLQKYEGVLFDQVVSGRNATKLNMIESHKPFDVAMTSLMPFERLIVKTQEMPALVWASFMPQFMI